MAVDRKGWGLACLHVDYVTEATFGINFFENGLTSPHHYLDDEVLNVWILANHERFARISQFRIRFRNVVIDTVGSLHGDVSNIFVGKTASEWEREPRYLRTQ